MSQSVHTQSAQNTGSAVWHAVIPAEHCYWMHLTEHLTDNVQAQAYRFESVLPLAAEELHISSLHLADKSFILCAVEHAYLAQRIASDLTHSSTRCILAPAAAPDFLPTLSQQQLSALNFLHGAYLSQPQRRWQRRFLGCTAVAVALAAIFLLMIIFKQQSALHRYRAHSTQAEYELLRQEFPTTADAHLYGALEQARRRLAQQQDSAIGSTNPSALATQMMQQWPTDIADIHIESINFQAQRLFIRGHSASIDSAQSLWSALARINIPTPQQNWRAQALQAQQDPVRGTVFQIILQRSTLSSPSQAPSQPQQASQGHAP